MLVKDLSNSFNPYPKGQKIHKKRQKTDEEFCIMPKSTLYSNMRFKGSERHEIFEGRTGNRDKSIEDGLVIFITPIDHREGKKSVHKDPKNKRWVEIRKIAQKVWMEYYHKTKEEFKQRYGRNYLD